MTVRLDQLPPLQAHQRLREGNLRLAIGPVVVSVGSRLGEFAEWMLQLYGHYPVLPTSGFSDFHIRLERPRTTRRWWRSQVCFLLDGEEPFKPLPLSHACAFFEWGLNWCIAERLQEYVIVHAAVVERDGRAMVLTGPPGAGKSTLCAGLMVRGWRLLSDELALLDPERGWIQPVPRPVGLKGASIEVIRGLAPQLVMGKPIEGTGKGTVAHVRAPDADVERAHEPARGSCIVFPRYEAGVALRVAVREPALVLRGLLDAAFNHPVQGERAVHGLVDLVECSSAYDVRFADLAKACQTLESLVTTEREGSRALAC